MMFRSILPVLVVVCLVTLAHHVQLGQPQQDTDITVARIAAAVYEALHPELQDIKNELNCLKEAVSELNETVTILAGESEEHRIETETKLEDLQTSLQFVIDNPPIEAISTRVLLLLLPYLNDVEHDIKTELGQLVVSQSEEVKECINQTALQLVDIQSSLQFSCQKLFHIIMNLNRLRLLFPIIIEGFNTTSSELTSHDTKLDLLSTQITGDFNDVRTELSVMSDKIEDHENNTANTLMDIVCFHQDPNGPCYTCGGTGGWRRVVYLDMTDPYTNCPSGWSETVWNETGYVNSSVTKRTCGRATDGYYTCDSTYFPVIGGPYSQVCGRIKAYQYGWTLGFYASYRRRFSINEAYFSGVAVMHGSPRQHIWTFAAGAENAYYYYYPYYTQCPCDTSLNPPIPPFVGNDYFCESGNMGFVHNYVLHCDDPLWDGDGCVYNSTCCTFNNPPTFTKYLATPTTDYLELRLCCYQSSEYEDIAVELIELYVK